LANLLNFHKIMRVIQSPLTLVTQIKIEALTAFIPDAYNGENPTAITLHSLMNHLFLTLRNDNRLFSFDSLPHSVDDAG
jgi:hypothetical protein